MFVTELGTYGSYDARARVDLTRTLVTMPYAHDAVHRDKMVNSTHYSTDGTADILYFITAADQEVHLEYGIKASGAVQALLYEEPDIATAGSSTTTARLYRPSTATITTTVTVGGTVNASDYGTLIKHQYNGGGGQGAGIFGGSSVHEGAEWVLKINTSYCLRIIRATSQVVGVEFEWYEVPPYGGRQ